ncbi:hypothetical protein ACJJI3_11730 [Microbulbifer sp. ZKSA004]|uniref:hypothetical protein n=1 Tax=Microbulbifer sp. ZKSA004 TaxID=3243389 RepID=UPI0040393AFA
MCNAWNHHPDCRCGWGGIGSKGDGNRGVPIERYFEPMEFSWVPPISESLESYTIPNASCPVCGQLVFFYRSPYGGRVFFEELGPPWTKHPCTDSSSVPSPANLSGRALVRYKWQVDGWSPFFIEKVEDIDSRILKIYGRENKKEYTFYIGRVVSRFQSNPIVPGVIAQIKIRENENAKISIITNFGSSTVIYGYKFRSDVVTGPGRKRRSRKIRYKC